MSTLVLPQSMVADRDAGIKANAQHVDDNFNALASAVNGKLDLDGTSTPTADITLGNHKLTNVATPTLSGDAATKGYVDSANLLKANLASPTFTGTPSAPTPSTSDNSTKIATTAFVVDVLKAIYPVGSIYIGTQNTCPMEAFFGTWTPVQGRYLFASGTLHGTSENYAAGATAAGGAPNITGEIGRDSNSTGFCKNSNRTGCFNLGAATANCTTSTGTDGYRIKFDASGSNATYGKSATIRAPLYSVNVWRRTA